MGRRRWGASSFEGKKHPRKRVVAGCEFHEVGGGYCIWELSNGGRELEKLFCPCENVRGGKGRRGSGRGVCFCQGGY